MLFFSLSTNSGHPSARRVPSSEDFLFRRVLCAPNEPRRNGILGQIILVDAGSVTLPLPVIPQHP